MRVSVVFEIAEGLSGEQRLQLVAILLGIAVFIAIVLVAERRNARHEAVPPGLTGGLSTLDPPREVRRGPATAIPIASAREGADRVDSPDPYPVPFLAQAEAPAEPQEPTEPPAVSG